MDLEQKWRWAKEMRRPYEKTALINVAFYSGEQWIYYDKTTGSIKNIRSQLPSHRVTMVVNQVQPTVRTELAKLTKQRPTFMVVSNRMDWDVKGQAEVENAIMEHIWRATKLDERLERALLWAVLTGKGYLIPRWDKDAGDRIIEYQTQIDPLTGMEVTDEEGNPIPIIGPNGVPVVKHDFNLGEIKVDTPSWFEIYVDPMATCDDDVNWFFRDRVLETATVEDIYGEKVPAEKGVETIELLDNRVLGRRYVEGRDVCVLREYVERPNRKYPYGRYVVFTAGGTKTLFEGKNPWVEADIEMPLTSITHIPFPGRYQGESVVTQLVPVQVELNKTHSQIIEAKNLTAQPKYLAPKGALPQGYVITTRPGEIVEYNPTGPAPFPMQAPQIPSYVIRELDTIKQEIIEISGIHEASRGSIPSNVRSGVAIAYIQEQDECVDVETEALTKTGWKRYKELSIGEEILAFDPKTHKLVWQPIKGMYINENYKGELTVLDNWQISSRTTPNHKFWVRSAQRPQRGYFQTTSLLKDHCIPLVADRVDGDIENVSFSDEFLELVGIVVSDGTFRCDCDGVEIAQSIRKNPEKVERIRHLLKETGLDEPREYLNERKGVLRFYVNSWLGKRLREVAPGKIPSYEFITSLSKRQLQVLINGLVLGDGTVRGKSTMYFTCDKKLADTVQTIGILAGYVTKITTKKVRDTDWTKQVQEYEVRFKAGNFAGDARVNHALKAKEEYEGVIWCPSVESGFWLSRRDGKHNITGNTRLNLTAHSYERAIASVCTKALKLGRYHYDEPRKVAIVGRNKRSSVVEFTGKDIPEDADVHVEAGSSLPQSVIAKQQFLLDMWNAGIIRDQRLILKLLQFGNLEDLYDDAELDIEHAQRENKRMQQGIPVEVEDFHNHEIHIMEHDRFRKSAEYDEAPLEIKQLFTAHVAQHLQFLAPRLQQQPQIVDIQGGEQSGYGR